MDRDFKGVWIPKEIWLDTRLNALDKVILVEIDSLDDGENGCYASNKYLSEFCQCSATKVSNAISKLTECGYIEQTDFDGRHRKIRSCFTKIERQPYKICKADLQNVQANNIDNNKDNNIEYIVEQYNLTSMPTCKKLTDSRKKKIAKRIIDFGVDGVVQAFQKAEQSDFLSGRSGKWQCNLDWLIFSQDHMEKVLEGVYDNKKALSKDELELKQAYDAIRGEDDGDGLGFGE